MAVLSIRTEDILKEQVQAMCNSMWISLSSLVNGLLKKTLRSWKVEFSTLTENWFTPEYEREILDYSEKIKNDPSEIVAVCETDEDIMNFHRNLSK